MKPARSLAIACLTSLACLALPGTLVAHENAKNPAVIKRMDAMEAIGGAMKVLAGMAKGEMAFDAEKTQAAFAVIADKGALVPGFFEAEETDPVTEALPAIWKNWDDFVQKSDAMVSAARSVGTVTDQSALGGALGRVGATCKGCHKDYRKK